MKFFEKIANWQVFFILLCTAGIVFSQLFFADFVGDDKEQIYNYALVNSISSLPKVFFYHHVVLDAQNSLLSGYYKPLMLFYLYLTRMIFGIHPSLFHIFQIALVSINSYLLFLLLIKFFRRSTAFFLSILFLVHPINQEVAAYISNVQEVLFFLFGISGLLLATRKNGSVKNFTIITIFLFLSLLSKEAGILFVGILLIYEFFFTKKLLNKSFFYIAVVLGLYSLLRFSSKGTDVFWIEPPPMAKVIFLDRIKHIPLIFFYYIKTFFYPDVLAFNQQWIVNNFQAKTFLLPLIFDLSFIGVLISSVFLFFKKKLSFQKELLFFTIWFFVGILPHLQIVALDATVATRWFYFSSVGILGIFGVTLETIEKKYIHTTHAKKVGISILALLLLLFSFRTYSRDLQWKDAYTLYSTDSEISKSPLLENNLGDEYFKRGDFINAKKHFQNALTLNPDLWIAINNFGVLSEQNKDYEKALSYYSDALKKSDRLPIYENIGRVLVLSRKPNDADVFLNKALIKYPLSAKLWLTKSLANYDMGNLNDALQFAQKSYTLLPDPKTKNVIEVISERLRSENK